MYINRGVHNLCKNTAQTSLISIIPVPTPSCLLWLLFGGYKKSAAEKFSSLIRFYRYIHLIVNWRLMSDKWIFNSADSSPNKTKKIDLFWVVAGRRRHGRRGGHDPRGLNRADHPERILDIHMWHVRMITEPRACSDSGVLPSRAMQTQLLLTIDMPSIHICIENALIVIPKKLFCC